MDVIRLIGRSSQLSRVQMDKVKQTITTAFPGIKVQIITRESKGDQLQDIPLQTVEGADFFTQDIFDSLKAGEADIAVHSLKDMSAAHFFGGNFFAVTDRDDVRDVVIFNNDIETKLRNGDDIIIGTCSPRREEMAIGFLQKALPQIGSFTISTKIIRGNIDTRLRKLDSGEYDGIILATAGLNRLPSVKKLLDEKKIMLLPLIECAPAPCQGAIVAEADASNQRAIHILQTINNEDLFADCRKEKEEAAKYGIGCLQKFGVVTLHTKNGKWLYAGGESREGQKFSNWHPLPQIDHEEKILFSSTDHMKDFFVYEYDAAMSKVEQPVIFVANYKTVQSAIGKEIFTARKILASGTKTWYELARQGLWVTACADGLGFEYLLKALEMPILGINPESICIITHKAAAERWAQKNIKAVGSYELIPSYNVGIVKKIAAADIVFWSSFSQFQFYSGYCKQHVQHCSVAGETASLIKQQGIEPVIFPTIKAFEAWRKISFPLRSVA